MFKTDGVNTSQCYYVTSAGDVVLTQPTAFPLTAGVDYEFSVDLHYTGGPALVYMGIEDATARTQIGPIGAAGGVGRYLMRFQPPRSGNHTIDLRIGYQGYGANMYVDNVVVRPWRQTTFQVHGTRRAGTTHTFSVYGPANSIVTLFLGASGYGPPFTLPPCQGEWLLAPQVFVVIPYAILTASGEYQGSLPVPASVAGVRFYWQTVEALGPCTFGCPVMIGFE